jgi:hypothetical protein
VVYRPTVINQNVVAYMNSNNGDDPNDTRNSNAFLPSIPGSSSSKKDGKFGMDESPMMLRTPGRPQGKKMSQ